MNGDDLIRDMMQSAQAMVAHIEMRILQGACNGRVSHVVSEDVRKMCDAIADQFEKAAITTSPKEGQEDG